MVSYFNPLKTEDVLFTLKKLDFLIYFNFDNVSISFVDSDKHLRVTLSSNGQWHMSYCNYCQLSN